MKNNQFELIGNICGDLRLLREATDDQVMKVEIIIIPNDVLDRKGNQIHLGFTHMEKQQRMFTKTCIMVIK